jgi:hypothetical protein
MCSALLPVTAVKEQSNGNLRKLLSSRYGTFDSGNGESDQHSCNLIVKGLFVTSTFLGIVVPAPVFESGNKKLRGGRSTTRTAAATEGVNERVGGSSASRFPGGRHCFALPQQQVALRATLSLQNVLVLYARHL